MDDKASSLETTIQFKQKIFSAVPLLFRYGSKNSVLWCYNDEVRKAILSKMRRQDNFKSLKILECWNQIHQIIAKVVCTFAKLTEAYRKATHLGYLDKYVALYMSTISFSFTQAA